MTSVLVVDDDAPLGRALARELRAHGYESIPVSGYDEAIERLSAYRYDVLLTDLRMGEKDGLDLILAIAESYPGTRPILMSAYATARDSERANELGAVRVLCKPFDTTDMLQAVERAVESAEGFLGSLHGLSLIDMLQMFHYAQRSLSVQVLGGLPAALHLQAGQIVHATYGEAEGEAAVSQILALPAGTLSTSPLESVQKTISRDFQLLMLDLLRRLDEQKRGPGAMLDGASNEGSTRTRDPSSDGAFGDSGLGSSSALIDLGLETSAPPAAASSPVGDSASEAHPDPGLLFDACRRTASDLSGDVVCVVVDLERARLLGSFATRGDAGRRGEALARVTLALFRDAPMRGLAGVLGEGAIAPRGGLRRIELVLEGGQYLARATRQGRRVMVLMLGQDTDSRRARLQLDAVFPLVEALAP